MSEIRDLNSSQSWWLHQHFPVSAWYILYTHFRIHWAEIFLSVTLSGILWQPLNASQFYWGREHLISQTYSFIFKKNPSLNSLAPPWLAGGKGIFGGSIFSRLVLHWCISGSRLVSVVLSVIVSGAEVAAVCLFVCVVLRRVKIQTLVILKCFWWCDSVCHLSEFHIRWPQPSCHLNSWVSGCLCLVLSINMTSKK